MPNVVNMHDAKSSLSRLAKRAAAGEDIVIARNGSKPVALLTRVPARRRSTPLGAFKGRIHVAEDFDAILPEFEPYL